MGLRACVTQEAVAAALKLLATMVRQESGNDHLWAWRGLTVRVPRECEGNARGHATPTRVYTHPRGTMLYDSRRDVGENWRAGGAADTSEWGRAVQSVLGCGSAELQALLAEAVVEYETLGARAEAARRTGRVAKLPPFRLFFLTEFGGNRLQPSLAVNAWPRSGPLVRHAPASLQRSNRAACCAGGCSRCFRAACAIARWKSW
jgi:hypothetical protein